MWGCSVGTRVLMKQQLTAERLLARARRLLTFASSVVAGAEGGNGLRKARRHTELKKKEPKVYGQYRHKCRSKPRGRRTTKAPLPSLSSYMFPKIQEHKPHI